MKLKDLQGNTVRYKKDHWKKSFIGDVVDVISNKKIKIRNHRNKKVYEMTLEEILEIV